MDVLRRRLLGRRAAYTVDDKVVLVTGALTEVGRRLAAELVGRGARVALVDSAADGSGERLSGEINGQTGLEATVYIRTDLRSQHDVRLMVEMAVLTFGRLDVLVNNAEQHAGELAGEEDAQRIGDSIDINLRAPIVATWVFSRYLAQSGNEGVAVNVTAAAGLLPGRGREVYGAANAGLIHFTEASRALAPALRVCALAPYYVAPPHSGRPRVLPGQRLGSPLLAVSSDQVARAVVRCIEDTRLAGRTVVVAGDSAYASRLSYLLSLAHMLVIMACSVLVLAAQRIAGVLRAEPGAYSEPATPDDVRDEPASGTTDEPPATSNAKKST
ncbi:hypothetical protein H4R18_000417 [Coemansia javaensis]|uniref:Ketoreductase domain-containing protein n=1 Tax=Coemansia javaensis TaxID=2761396 RepID=A0A9W8LLR3_9FUNG|nr:hypothetical protein H4R18_000417 [Coemansia javaensis]